MIKARLIPAPLRQDLAVEAYRQVIKEGRSAIAAARRASRVKALRYATHIRSRGFDKGYREGLSAGQSECSSTITALRDQYHRALDQAHQDVQTLARQLASQVVDTLLLEKPEIFSAWVQQAIATLKRSKALHLTLNPRYEQLLTSLMKTLPEGVTTSLDPAVGSIDFRLEGEVGGVEFAWRNVIEHADLRSGPTQRATDE